MTKPLSSGFQAAIKWQVNTHLTQEVAYQQQSGKDDQAQNLVDILGSRIDIKTQWQRGNWMVYNLIQHGLTQDEVGDGEGELKSYIRWSLTTAVQITDSVQLSIYGKNLLNQYIRVTADEDAAQLQGRNFGLKLKYQF